MTGNQTKQTHNSVGGGGKSPAAFSCFSLETLYPLENPKMLE